MKIFVQGDRRAKNIKILAKRIARLMEKKNIEVILGAYGELINIFYEAGCNIRCFGHRNDSGNVVSGVPYVDCMKKAGDIGFPDRFIPAWGIRMGLILGDADACLFLPGSRGTIAHLIPAIVIAEKHKGRIAVVGWKDEQVRAIHGLLPNLEKDVFRSFSSAGSAQAINFLIA